MLLKNQQPNSNKEPEGKQQNPNQDLYDIFVAQGIKLAGPLSEKMKGKASIDTLGNALFEIVKRVENEGVKNGVKFPIEVLLHGSNEILAHLIQWSGVQIDEQQTKAVIGMAVGKYLQDAVKSGKMTAQQVQELGQQAQQSAQSNPQGQQPGGVSQQGVPNVA